MSEDFLKDFQGLAERIRDKAFEAPTQDLNRLQELQNSLCNVKYDFAPGQLVDYKQGLKNKKASGPFVVIEVLPEAVAGTSDESGSTYFREPLDIILGNCNADGELVVFHYDSRRFQPYVPPEAH